MNDDLDRLVLGAVGGAASALEAAHERGLIHCDVKPANIFLTRRGGTKVLDFGPAKLQRHVGTEVLQAARDARASGTRDYMSPEQARGEELDQRTDVFSLGVVIRTMDGGQTPAPRLDDATATRIADFAVDTNRRVTGQTAMPGSETAVRRTIEELRVGQPTLA
jgi:serine/threonine protein kinase